MTPADRARAVVEEWRDPIPEYRLAIYDNQWDRLADLVAMALRAERAAVWREAAIIASAYFEPCEEPADISARECGEQIAAALRARWEAGG